MVCIDHREVDPSRTNWLNTLPLLKDRHVLQIGITNNTKAIVKCGCASLTCVCGDSKNRLDPGVSVVASPDSMEVSSMDICIVDDVDMISKKCVTGDFYIYLRKIARTLSRNGALVIGFPKGIRQGILKLRADHMVEEAGFRQVNWFVCEPSFEDPLYVCPYYQNTPHVKEELKSRIVHEAKPATLIKNLIKTAFINTTYRLNPFWGTMLVAYKNEVAHPGGYLVEALKNILKGQKINTDDAIVVWSAKHFTGKQIGLVHDYSTGEKLLVAVCKVANYPYHCSSKIRQEYNILSHLSPHQQFFAENNICVPSPIYFETNGVWSSSIETPVHGYPLSEMNLHMDPQYLKTTLQKLVQVQLRIQQHLTKHLKDKLPVLKPDYFHNSLDVPYKYLEDSGRLQHYSETVQHGDYTDVNILYEQDSKTWGVIDWEWTSSGFPPLFDLFHLIFSLKFSEKDKLHDSLIDKYFQSFIDSFFCRNWFSEYVRKLVVWYCGEECIDASKVFDYFMDSLLFIFNKYRLDYHLPEYETMHRNMILYSLSHRAEFTVL